MQGTICLNCGAALHGYQHYCSNCGQKSNTERITNRNLLRDFFVYFTHADRGIFNLLKGLTLYPGKVAAEYVEGKRKTYFNPFTFLALCVAFMAFLNNQLKPYNAAVEPNPRIMAHMPDERLKDLYVLSVQRNSKAQNFLNKYLTLISVAITPYFGFFLWLFFRGRKRNMAEISVAYILFTGFANVVTTLLISPILALNKQNWSYYFILYGSLVLQNIYFAWGMKSFFRFKTAGGFFRVLAVLGISGLVGLILALFAYYFYVYHGGAFEVLQYINRNWIDN